MITARHALPAQAAAQERLLDCLADLLFDADEALDILRSDDAASFRWMEPHVRQVWDELNALMKQVCD